MRHVANRLGVSRARVHQIVRLLGCELTTVLGAGAGAPQLLTDGQAEQVLVYHATPRRRGRPPRDGQTASLNKATKQLTSKRLQP